MLLVLDKDVKIDIVLGHQSSNPDLCVFAFEDFERVRFCKLQGIIAVVVLAFVDVLNSK